METYQIIKDIEKLNLFIEEILVDNDADYYVSLLARKKWLKQNVGLTADRCQLKRFTTKKKDLVKKILQLEIPLGGYDFNGVVVPQEALGVYISPNSTNTKNATFALSKRLLELIQNDQFNFNLQQEALSVMQTNVNRTYFDIDVDFTRELTSDEITEAIQTFVNIFNYVEIVKTRGGFHVLVDPKTASRTNKNWYNDVKGICDMKFTVTIANSKKLKENCGNCEDKNKDEVVMDSVSLIPLAGCTQGGYVPYLMDLTNFYEK